MKNTQYLQDKIATINHIDSNSTYITRLIRIKNDQLVFQIISPLKYNQLKQGKIIVTIDNEESTYYFKGTLLSVSQFINDIYVFASPITNIEKNVRRKYKRYSIPNLVGFSVTINVRVFNPMQLGKWINVPLTDISPGGLQISSHSLLNSNCILQVELRRPITPKSYLLIGEIVHSSNSKISIKFINISNDEQVSLHKYFESLLYKYQKR